jgi:hypothetical protein
VATACSIARRNTGEATAEGVEATEESRVWKPDSPPRPLLIRGVRAVSREAKLLIRARPRVQVSFLPSFGPNPYYHRRFSFRLFTGLYGLRCS